MSKLVIVASLILTAVMLARGYVVIFVTGLIAMALKLPGPYADEPIAWVWFGLHIIMLFGASFLFCRWLATRVERKSAIESTFA